MNPRSPASPCWADLSPTQFGNANFSDHVLNIAGAFKAGFSEEEWKKLLESSKKYKAKFDPPNVRDHRAGQTSPGEAK